MTDPRRALPGVDTLLARAAAEGRLEGHAPARVREALRAALAAARAAVTAGGADVDPGDPDPHLAFAERWLERDARPSLRRVVNATGVVLHTNLGRAPLAAAAREAMVRAAEGYENLEFDLERGARGSRYVHCAALISELTGAEDALVVNNCAGGLVLALNALARGRDVVVSRGEMVEIGGGFRIPEVLEQAGAGLREVGATNRTRIEDYRAAVRAGGVAALLKVHRSNFRIGGFTEEASLAELADLARQAEVPLVHDLGSGLLADAAALGLPPEPTPHDSLAAGAGLVVFSGDKLLGGPQAGLVAGRRELVARLRGSPLCRALRVDKATLAALEATLRLYRDPERAVREIPVLEMLTRPLDQLDAAAGELARAVAGVAARAGARVSVGASTGRVGGGTFPEHPLPARVLRVESAGGGGEGGAMALAARLRGWDPPVVARVEGDALLVDPRTLQEGEPEIVRAALVAALAQAPGSVDPPSGLG
ncbi:MAG: L-seryl-tRNA(Sec) selenium transferase [Longimicrobiales bacterium]|nr:L-seryl-tRNA(Sec) selenium transferase [Longimicrobiales bacterium]